jgi:hypothetical protein
MLNEKDVLRKHEGMKKERVLTKSFGFWLVTDSTKPTSFVLKNSIDEILFIKKINALNHFTKHLKLHASFTHKKLLSGYYSVTTTNAIAMLLNSIKANQITFSNSA